MMWGYPGFGGGWGGLWGGLGFLFMIAFWVAVVVLIVWAVRWLIRSGESHPREQSPLDIAKARYARGEISREQFEQIKRDLS